MLNDSYKLFEIIDAGGVHLLQVVKINYNLNKRLKHDLDIQQFDINKETEMICLEHNNEQVKSITKSIEEVKKLLHDNPISTKRKNQLEYLSNTLDHFVNWYGANDLQLPHKFSLMEWSKGSFFANKDFSRISIYNNLYRLRRNQSKVVKLLFENLTDELDGLSYYEMARALDLTSTGKLSNYFKDSPRVGDVFNHSRSTGKYSLKH